MENLSIIILARNEERQIARCIQGASLIGGRIILADTGSLDQTREIARAMGASIIELPWEGFGKTRNSAARAAGSTWVLFLDADEVVSAPLASRINTLVPETMQTAYGFRRLNFLGSRLIRFGEWGRDRVLRLYNPAVCSWRESLVHETLIAAKENQVFFPETVLHYTAENTDQIKAKESVYLNLAVAENLRLGKKPGMIKRYGSPCFNFFKNFLFLGGFLDGKPGLDLAAISARNVYLKYRQLSGSTR